MQSRRSKVFLVMWATGALGVSGTLPAVGHTQLTLYDAFTTRLLPPAKWDGVASGLIRPGAAELLRSVHRGRLRLLLLAYGNTVSASGRGFVQLGLAFPTPSPITAVQAEMTVTHAFAQDCPANAASSLAEMQLVRSRLG
jgi:hypothetical protein